MSLARQEEVALENLLREIVGEAPVQLPPRLPEGLRPDAAGRILNPATGKMVLATGRAVYYAIEQPSTNPSTRPLQYSWTPECLLSFGRA